MKWKMKRTTNHTKDTKKHYTKKNVSDSKGAVFEGYKGKRKDAKLTIFVLFVWFVVVLLTIKCQY